MTAKETDEVAPQKKRLRGFAMLDRNHVKEIAARGGRAAHASGKAHHFSSDEARAAGKLGGRASHAKRLSATDLDENSKESG